MNFTTECLTDTENTILFLTLIVTLFVGFLSILLTAVTLYWQRKHDQLSVRPIPIILTNNFALELSIPIENGGLGPLIIKTIKVGWYDDNNYKRYDVWSAQKFLKERESIIINYNALAEYPTNTVLPAGKSMNLFYCKIDPKIIKQRIEMNTIRNDLKKIFEFQIYYLDMYGNKFCDTIPVSTNWDIIDPYDEKLFN